MHMANMHAMDLKTYIKPRGVCPQLAAQLGISNVTLYQWAVGLAAVPEARAPSIEAATNFTVRVESVCPNTRWHRLPHPGWPHGKPLIDKTPEVIMQPKRPKPAKLES